MAQTASFPRRSLSPAIRTLLAFAALPVILLGAIVLATLVGDVTISPGSTIRILLHGLGLYAGPVTWPQYEYAIIWQVRFPRVLAAALVGAALAVAGTLFQAVLRNPLADPYVIGTSAGAQLGVSVALLVPVQFALFGFGFVQALAFLGALTTVLFVYFLARTRGRTPVVTLLLAGFVTSSFLISASSLVLQVSGKLNQVMVWTLGSLDVAGTRQLAVAAPVILLASFCAYLLSRGLDVILLGEEHAMHLGIRVEVLKLTAVSVAALLTALAVSLAGVVAFVGLIVPHAARLIFGPEHRVLIPAAALGGSTFLILADLIARTAMPPTPLPLGVVTAVIGAPFFLYLLRRSRRNYGV